MSDGDTRQKGDWTPGPFSASPNLLYVYAAAEPKSSLISGIVNFFLKTVSGAVIGLPCYCIVLMFNPTSATNVLYQNASTNLIYVYYLKWNLYMELEFPIKALP